MSEMQQTTSLCGGVKKAKQSKAPRRPAQFWAPLNNWWRGYFAETGQRPVTSHVQEWFERNGDSVWGLDKPTWKEARIHAKCLRSTDQVKNYFREYRARNRASGENRPSRRSPVVKVVKTEPVQQDDDNLIRSITKHNVRVARLGSLPAGGGSGYDGGDDSSVTEDDFSEDCGPRREDSSAEMCFPNMPPKPSPFRVSSFTGIPGLSMPPSSSSLFPTALVTTGGAGGGGRTSSSTTMSWPPVAGDASEMARNEIARCYSGMEPAMVAAIDRCRSLVTSGPSRQPSAPGALTHQAVDNKRRLTAEDIHGGDLIFSQELRPLSLASIQSLPVRLQPQQQGSHAGPVSADALETIWAQCNMSQSSSDLLNEMKRAKSAHGLQLGNNSLAPRYPSHGGFTESMSGSLMPSGRPILPEFRSFTASGPNPFQVQLQPRGSLGAGTDGNWPHSEEMVCDLGGNSRGGTVHSRLARCSFAGSASQFPSANGLLQQTPDWRQRRLVGEDAMQARLRRPFSERGTDPTQGLATGIPVTLESSRSYAHRQMEMYQAGQMQIKTEQHYHHMMHADPLPLPPALCFDHVGSGRSSPFPQGNSLRSPQGSVVDNLDIPCLAPQLQRLHVNSSNGILPSSGSGNLTASHLEQQQFKWDLRAPNPEEPKHPHQGTAAMSWLQQVWLKEEPDAVFDLTADHLSASAHPRAREYSSSGGLLIQVPAPLSSDSATTSGPSDRGGSPHTGLERSQSQQPLQRQPSIHNNAVEGADAHPRLPTMVSCAPVSAVALNNRDASRLRRQSDGLQVESNNLCVPDMDWEQHEEEALIATQSWLLGDLLEAGGSHMQ